MFCRQQKWIFFSTNHMRDTEPFTAFWLVSSLLLACRPDMLPHYCSPVKGILGGWKPCPSAMLDSFLMGKWEMFIRAILKWHWGLKGLNLFSHLDQFHFEFLLSQTITSVQSLIALAGCHCQVNKGDLAPGLHKGNAVCSLPIGWISYAHFVLSLSLCCFASRGLVVLLFSVICFKAYAKE